MEGEGRKKRKKKEERQRRRGLLKESIDAQPSTRKKFVSSSVRRLGFPSAREKTSSLSLSPVLFRLLVFTAQERKEEPPASMLEWSFLFFLPACVRCILSIESAKPRGSSQAEREEQSWPGKSNISFSVSLTRQHDCWETEEHFFFPFSNSFLVFLSP